MIASLDDNVGPSHKVDEEPVRLVVSFFFLFSFFCTKKFQPSVCTATPFGILSMKYEPFNYFVQHLCFLTCLTNMELTSLK